MSRPQYTTEEFTREVPVEEFIAQFHRPDKVWGYCRACSNYGKQWGCPPFDFDVAERLSNYRYIRLIATRITLLDKSISPREINLLLRPERVRLERLLLEMERTHDGLACTYIGECLHCPAGTCSRLCGAPCRHPALVRPSLEAYGFELSQALHDLFDLDLKWCTTSSLPNHLILLCGLFHTPQNRP